MSGKKIVGEMSPEFMEEFIRVFCTLGKAEEHEPKQSGRHSKKVDDELFEVTYVEWVLGKLTTKEATKQLGIHNEKFYKLLTEKGRRSKSEVKVDIMKAVRELEADERTLIDNMSCEDALEVVERIIQKVKIPISWLEKKHAHTYVAIRVLITFDISTASKKKWNGKMTSEICEDLNVSKKSYNKFCSDYYDEGFMDYCDLIRSKLTLKKGYN